MAGAYCGQIEVCSGRAISRELWCRQQCERSPRSELAAIAHLVSGQPEYPLPLSSELTITSGRDYHRAASCKLDKRSIIASAGGAASSFIPLEKGVALC